MWETFSNNLIPIIFVVITSIVVVLVKSSLDKLAAKWQIENALQYDNKIDELVIKGIKAMEQKSLAAKAKGGEVTPGDQKLDQAMKFVNAQLADMKLPQKATNELSMLVEAKIFDGAKTPGSTIPPPFGKLPASKEGV